MPNAARVAELQALSRETAEQAARLEAVGDHALADLLRRLAALLQLQAEDYESED